MFLSITDIQIERKCQYSQCNQIRNLFAFRVDKEQNKTDYK